MSRGGNLKKVCGRCGEEARVRRKACVKCGTAFPGMSAKAAACAPTPRPSSDGLPVYAAKRDFSHPIGGATVKFEAGKPITDERILAALFACDAPIEAIDPSKELIRCPCCGNVFVNEKLTEN